MSRHDRDADRYMDDQPMPLAWIWAMVAVVAAVLAAVGVWS